MGSGSWSATDYHERATIRKATGADTFAYSAKAVSTGVMRPHQTLDPQGLRLRESRDNPEHSASNPVVIGLDVTGSMGAVVRGIHADLPRLHELLLGHKYLPDPQILFAAVGDATCDRVPLQVGQFESDNRMDQNLENMVLEGGGGGQKTESYELTMYVAARHTVSDAYEKRGRKGYLFLIGDEMAYPAVSRAQVRKLIGDHVGLEADVPLDRIVAEVKERWHLYFLIPGGASYGADKEVRGFWERLVGPERVIQLESPEDTSECIGLTIGMNEGAIDQAGAREHLRKRGVVGRTIDRITAALGGVAGLGAAPPAGPVVKAPAGRRL